MDNVFDQQFLASLERLSLQARKIIAGKHSGERRSPNKGSSVEFADFRNYSSGDDFRHIDWNAYARSERLFLKLFMEEQDLLLTIFIDLSQSMEWGEPTKARMAKQIAAAFAYLALTSFDRVAIACCSDNLRAYLPPLRGRAALKRVWDFIAGLPCEGNTDLNKSLQDFGRYARGGGMSLVISDFMSPSGYDEGLKYLQYLKQDVAVLHLLAPDEITPPLNGDLRLVDCESGDAREVTITPLVLKAYQRKLQEYSEGIRNFCYQRNFGYLQLSTSEPLEDIILRSLPGAGILGKR
jgi:uncharacterized protein (DUF58 family)